MNEARLGSPEMLHLLWVLPALAGLFLYGFRKKDQALTRFSERHLLIHINASVSRTRQWGKAFMVITAALFIIISLTRPAWNPRPEKIERKGRDIAILLDVSKSMLADDLKPNRLGRAKLAIQDLLDQLEGDRVALIAFAGSAAVKCPLTLDYGFFRSMLDDIGVDSIARGGTLIGDALRKTLDEVFTDKLKRFKDIILITDGEDHDSFPVEASREAAERGVRLIVIGLGDENEGKRIPTAKDKGGLTFLRYQEKEVWSRLDSALLRKMVEANPGSRYLNVATGAFDLGSIYQNLLGSAEKRALEAMSMRRYEEKYQLFLAIGLALLLVEMLISERRTL